MSLDPGVLTLYTVTQKNGPTKVALLGAQADEATYQSHIKMHHLEVQAGYAGYGERLGIDRYDTVDSGIENQIAVYRIISPVAVNCYPA